MRATWAAALLAMGAWTAPAHADQAMFGPSRNGSPFVCADLNDVGARPNDAVGSWILGFWSGLNAANNALVGEATTANGVVGEVKLYCTAHPSVGLAQATFDTYAAMKKAKKH